MQSQDHTNDFRVKNQPFLFDISNNVSIKILILGFYNLFVKNKKSSIFISLDEIFSFSLLSQTKFKSFSIGPKNTCASSRGNTCGPVLYHFLG